MVYVSPSTALNATDSAPNCWLAARQSSGSHSPPGVASTNRSRSSASGVMPTRTGPVSVEVNSKNASGPRVPKAAQSKRSNAEGPPSVEPSRVAPHWIVVAGAQAPATESSSSTVSSSSAVLSSSSSTVSSSSALSSSSPSSEQPDPASPTISPRSTYRRWRVGSSLARAWGRRVLGRVRQAGVGSRDWLSSISAPRPLHKRRRSRAPGCDAAGPPPAPPSPSWRQPRLVACAHDPPAD